MAGILDAFNQVWISNKADDLTLSKRGWILTDEKCIQIACTAQLLVVLTEKNDVAILGLIGIENPSSNILLSDNFTV